MGELSGLSNPLPIHDANAELQRQSFHALYAITKPAGLIVRLTQYMDYGVDATIEILAANRVTNYVAQVQIKSAACAEPNRDGTVSRSIDTSNLNYLLNGTSPIYLFYSAERGEFWYTWAFDELRHLESQNPKWCEQQTVTIRFSRKLNEAGLEDIRARIAAESRCRREITDTLARYATQETAKFAIHRETLKTDDGERAYGALIEGGFTLVSCGLWQQVLAKVDLLAPCRRKEPRIQLVIAYAYYVQGRYLTALASCGEARLRTAELSSGDREVLNLLRDACECQIGKINRDEYCQRQIDAAAIPGASVQCRIEAVRFHLLSEKNQSRRLELLGQLRKLGAEVVADVDCSDSFKLQTRIHIAFAEGIEAQLSLFQSTGTFQVQLALRQPWAHPDARPMAEAAFARADWERRMQELIRDVDASGIPWLCAEARRTFLLVRTALIAFQRFQAKFFGVGRPPGRQEVDRLLTDARDVADKFSVAGNIEGEMRAKLAAADLYEILDDIPSAKRVASEAKSVAEALGLAEITRLADQHLTGTTPLKVSESDIRRNREGDQDVQWAAMSEADIDYYAERSLAASQLPADRLPVLRRDIEGMKHIATERLNWCRHIEQLQLLIHTWHPITAYAAPTEWTGKCRKHGYESLQPSTDMRLTTDRFKKSYCDGCPDRDPKMKRS
jgi:hypothetical protein